MSDFTDSQKQDFYKWYLDVPEEGFSPERNKKVIEDSILKARMMKMQKNKDYVETIRERADAVASYLKHIMMGHEKGVESYFGRVELARLRGQKIVEEVKGRMKRLISLD
jgi:hypothetical protein